MTKSNQSISYSSPAKINLFLKVLAKRQDGYHELESLFVRTPFLEDTITITPFTSEFELTCNDPALATDATNLIVKAKQALEKAAKTTISCHIHLEKRIPIGAGLGGGSSNAATTLLALNALIEKPLSQSELHDLGASLGADIPFFLLQTNASLAKGKGDVLEASKLAQDLHLVLIKPAFSVHTAQAYQLLESSLPLMGVSYEPQITPWGSVLNDLEIPVFKKYRYLAELRTWLQSHPGVMAARMSGSGSCLFAIMDSPSSAQKLIQTAHDQIDSSLWCVHGTVSAS